MESSRDWTRRGARLVLAAILLAGFGLRIASFRAGLPLVLHADFDQVTEAAQLLQQGEFLQRSPYPVTHVYVHAAVDLVAYGIGRAAGAWESFTSFVAELQGFTLSHAIARAYTALVGALLPLLVYRLARVRWGAPLGVGRGASRVSRQVALLAAALIAVSPAHVIHAHQARIHVPGITLLVLAAIAVARAWAALDRQAADPREADRRATEREQAGPVRRRLAVAGFACGAAASVIQLGTILTGAAVFRIAWVAKPWRREAGGGAWRSVLGAIGILLAAMAATMGVLWLLGHLPGVVTLPAGTPWLDRMSRLGITTKLRFDRLDHFPVLLWRWMLAEPTVALGLVLALVAGWCAHGDVRGGAGEGARPGASDRGEGRQPGVGAPFVSGRARDGLLYPALAFLALGTNYHGVRYSLSFTPFVVVVAAAGLLEAPRSATWRRLLVAAAIAVPLATSVRYDALLRVTDTRVATLAAVERLHAGGLDLAIDSSLVPTGARVADGIVTFPRAQDYREAIRSGGIFQHALDELGADAFVWRITRDGRGLAALVDPARAGFRSIGRAVPGAAPFDVVPDAPDLLVPDLWRATRPGPAVEAWVRDGASWVRVEASVEAAAERAFAELGLPLDAAR